MRYGHDVATAFGIEARHGLEAVRQMVGKHHCDRQRGRAVGQRDRPTQLWVRLLQLLDAELGIPDHDVGRGRVGEPDPEQGGDGGVGGDENGFDLVGRHVLSPYLLLADIRRFTVGTGVPMFYKARLFSSAKVNV